MESTNPYLESAKSKFERSEFDEYAVGKKRTEELPAHIASKLAKVVTETGSLLKEMEAALARDARRTSSVAYKSRPFSRLIGESRSVKAAIKRNAHHREQVEKDLKQREDATNYVRRRLLRFKSMLDRHKAAKKKNDKN